MKKISLIIFAALLSFSLFGLKVDADEKFTLSGKVTSISLTDQGGVINVSSKAGRYGKVFLTYNLKLDIQIILRKDLLLVEALVLMMTVIEIQVLVREFGKEKAISLPFTLWMMLLMAIEISVFLS